MASIIGVMLMLTPSCRRRHRFRIVAMVASSSERRGSLRSVCARAHGHAFLFLFLFLGAARAEGRDNDEVALEDGLFLFHQDPGF